MNLSPHWIPELRAAGHDAEHWSRIGDVRALDGEIMQWARDHGALVFTNDLDFGQALALTQAVGPSVIQIRTDDISPSGAGGSVLTVLTRFEQELTAGALVVIDERRQRVRVLPLQR